MIYIINKRTKSRLAIFDFVILIHNKNDLSSSSSSLPVTLPHSLGPFLSFHIYFFQGFSSLNLNSSE